MQWLDILHQIYLFIFFQTWRIIFIDINQIFFSIIGVGPTMLFSHLPPEIASNIFSFLSWQEKLWVCNVIPAWKPYLQSTHAWTWTHFNVASWGINSNAFNRFCRCLEDYGIYMQTCQAQGVHVEDLQMLLMYCKNLKSLEINLNQHRCVNSNDVRDLVLSLSAIVRETNLTTLALCGVTYDNDPVSGAEGLLVACTLFLCAHIVAIVYCILSLCVHNVL